MNAHSIAPFIQQYYPEYYSIERYPADRCASFCKVDGEWGILGNFGRTPLVVDGVTLKNSEQLFQLMKFKDEEPVKAVYQAGNPKYPAESHAEFLLSQKQNCRCQVGQSVHDQQGDT